MKDRMPTLLEEAEESLDRSGDLGTKEKQTAENNRNTDRATASFQDPLKMTQSHFVVSQPLSNTSLPNEESKSGDPKANTGSKL